MKNRKILTMVAVLLGLSLTACGGKPVDKSEPKSEQPSAEPSAPAGSSETQPASSETQPASSETQPASSDAQPSSSEAPVKAITVTSADFVNESGKVYFKVTGTQANHSATEFKWAWGIRVRNGDFAYGKETPEATDYAAAEFDASNAFTVKLCLTDIEGLSSGAFYRVYGGTPDTYGDIAFTNTLADIRDTTRHYYLRADQDNSFVYDAVQPLNFTKASIVGVETADLPDGVTQAGAYLKFGGVNAAGITMDMLNEWHTAGKIAGNFQRTVPNQYQVHNHADTERFYKIEGDDVYFYVYVGFIAEENGWMMHFDMVSGNSGANLNFETVIDGETYTIGTEIYKIYADYNKSGPENYYGCLGVYRDKYVDPSIHVHDYSTLVKENAAADGCAATKVYNCAGDCGTSVLRWAALDYDSSSTFVERNSDNVRFNTGSSGSNGVENKDQTEHAGPHIIYKINVESAMTEASLAFRIKNSSGNNGTAPVFSKIAGDSANGFSKQGDEYVDTGKRYGLKVNGVEYFLGDDAYGDQSGKTDWFDWPVTFPLQAGANTIDIFAYAGYRANMYEFQLTGFAAVTPAP